MKHVLSVTVNNSSGVLSHVSGLFTRRGYNIDSLSVGETEDPSKSVITLVVGESPEMVKQIEKQLYKLTDVLQIRDLSGEAAVKREMLLVTVLCDSAKRGELMSLVDVFEATIVDMNANQVMIEMIATPRRVSTFLGVLREYGIASMARTGTIALPFPSAGAE